ncbi:hypothetical protein LguiA_015632 [Lonicera macranthoides]
MPVVGVGDGGGWSGESGGRNKRLLMAISPQRNQEEHDSFHFDAGKILNKADTNQGKIKQNDIATNMDGDSSEMKNIDTNDGYDITSMTPPTNMEYVEELDNIDAMTNKYKRSYELLKEKDVEIEDERIKRAEKEEEEIDKMHEEKIGLVNVKERYEECTKHVLALDTELQNAKIRLEISEDQADMILCGKEE